MLAYPGIVICNAVGVRISGLVVAPISITSRIIEVLPTFLDTWIPSFFQISSLALRRCA